jgi:hypothetical protein
MATEAQIVVTGRHFDLSEHPSGRWRSRAGREDQPWTAESAVLR